MSIKIDSEDKVILLGHAHIDLAWLWTKDETIHLVSLGTFNYTLNLMREFPFLKFAQSSAQVYKWIEQYYPEVFKSIAEKIKSGQWEVVGGSWSEFSPNLTGEETLVRQYLYGKLYFKEKFGVDVKVAWLPDSFGFPWTLPQVLKKSGIDYFLTSKLNWQIERMKKPIPFPYHVFLWEAPNGSRVLSYLTPGGYNGLVKMESIISQLIRLKEKHGVNKLLFLFGYGDHGGGPAKHMINEALRLQKTKDFPKVSFGGALEYFRELDSSMPKERIPKYEDELYLKTHRGTFTTESRIKKALGELEDDLCNAEKLSTICYILYGGSYPKEELRRAWESLLYITTHDIADGTSIQDVYDEIFSQEYPEAKRIAAEAISKALSKMFSSSNERVAREESTVVVLNTLSWPTSKIISVPIEDKESNLQVYSLDDKAVKTQTVYEDNKWSLVFLAENLPSLGFKAFKIHRAQSLQESKLKVGQWFLENEFFKVVVDPESGLISSIFDKKSNFEVLDSTKRGNVLQLYEDMPPDAPRGEPAWNLYYGNKVELNKVNSIEIISSGPLVATIRVTRKYENSTFVQEISLYEGLPILDFKVKANWNEKYKTLKVSFPLSFSNDYATYGIQFGAIQRFRHDLESSSKEIKLPKRKWEEADVAKFEVSAHRWANVDNEDESYGVALLVKNKHGFSYEKNELKVTLLRGPRRGYPQQPEQWVDQSSDPTVGEHVISYSLYPHKGNWKTARVPNVAYEQTKEPIVFISRISSLPKEKSFMTVLPNKLVLTALKVSETNNDIIARVYNPYDEEVQAELVVPFEVKSANEVDLLESGEFLNKSLRTENGKVEFKINRFEITTIKLKKD
ncbi:MAG: alpha-mannosidase [Thaumarchaeota archaeon]|nr:alpha-mannosidase [Nitrososphaerota archaeon]